MNCTFHYVRVYFVHAYKQKFVEHQIITRKIRREMGVDKDESFNQGDVLDL